MVHIVYHEDEHHMFFKKDDEGNESINKFNVGNLIKAFSREYEGLILDWDIVDVKGQQYQEGSFNDALQERLYLTKGIGPQVQYNPILLELGYLDYYKRHKPYFDDRFKLNQNIPETIRRQYRQIAIMSILIDSYAHNISAHSLTALEWWFRQRAKAMETSERHPEQFDVDSVGIPSLVKSGMPLDNEIHPLLRFLLDKGAFWTGLTRENNFGGKISSLHSILWYDFVNNPLYLGTIAFSEEILRLNINITFLKAVDSHENIRFEKKVELDGQFVSIDLSKIVDPDQTKEKLEHSRFIIKGEKFDQIKERLKRFKVFFPGGVVGRHAFFTILENEIRNVKHFPAAELKEMKEKGLTLNISLEEDSYDKDMGYAYYKIGIWIKNPVKLNKELMVKRLESLYSDIIEDNTNRPKLGGIFQDKVCAAMLFNNSFSSVQDNKDKRGQRFYPWVKVASSKDLEIEEGKVIEDIEITARKYYEEEFKEYKAFFEEIYQPHQGYYKKFLHLWRGENIYRPKDLKNMGGDWENISRFRFVQLPREEEAAFQKCREEGLIRIIHEPTDSLQEAYNIWLAHWMKGKFERDISHVKFNVKPVGGEYFQLSALLRWTLDGTSVYTSRKQKADMNKYSKAEPMHRLNLVHGSERKEEDESLSMGEDVIRFRSHGIFRQYFCNHQPLRFAEISPVLAAELFEVLATRVCIFDNRLANRMQKANKKTISEKLFCDIYSEKVDIWQRVKQGGFDQFHFLVVHLSFLEAFRDEHDQKMYSENDIGEFIEREVLQGQAVSDNFILVITTGRGRTQWWNALKNEDKTKEKGVTPYASFVTFRPVESLIAAVENSISMKDDLELKYRLVKILFGS
jgi:hypothetical protein